VTGSTTIFEQLLFPEELGLWWNSHVLFLQHSWQ
jgi:hypothetical protein